MGVHHCRCCSATTLHTCCNGATALARCSASCSRQGPPCSEQNCLGTFTPCSFRVSPRRRLPSPAASTRAQILEGCFTDSHARSAQQGKKAHAVLLHCRNAPIAIG